MGDAFRQAVGWAGGPGSLLRLQRARSAAAYEGRPYAPARTLVGRAMLSAEARAQYGLPRFDFRPRVARLVLAWTSLGFLAAALT